jgi:hypothetical protein
MLKSGGPHYVNQFFIDQRGDCWFTFSGSDEGTLFCARGDSGRIDSWPDVLPEKNAKGRYWRWVEPLPDGDRCVLMQMLPDQAQALWLFDSTKVQDQPGGALTLIAKEGVGTVHLPSNCAGAMSQGRVYFIRGTRGLPIDKQDLHLISVAVDPKSSATVTDHGLIVDQDGRKPARVPAMAADERGRLFIVGGWYVKNGEKGSLRHVQGEQYKELARAEFFGVIDLTHQEK